MKLLLYKIVDGRLIATYGPNVREIVSRIKLRQLTTQQMSHFLVKYEILRRLQSNQDFRVSKYFVNIFMSKMWLTRQNFGYYTTGCLEKTWILVKLSFSDRNFGEHCVKLSAPSQKSVVDGDQRWLWLLLFVLPVLLLSVRLTDLVTQHSK